MANPAPDMLRTELADFVRYRREHLSGDEKGEAQVFLERLFRALGHEGLHQAGAVLEMRLKKQDQKGTAFADLMWKPRCLIEMKKAEVNLSRHYRQAFDYWVNAVPDRPRYVLLCNFDEFWVYDFDVQMDEPIDRVRLDDLVQRWEALAFLLPREREPIFGNDLVAVTRDAAASMAHVFAHMHERGVSREAAQRFTLQSVMAMFAEDIGLLPEHIYTRALEDSLNGGEAYDLLFGLFREMNTPGVTPGGRYRGTPYFNGGLFSNVNPFELRKDELDSLARACQTDWSAVRPEIFGTLFEQSMAEGERHAYGAHFTSQADIVKIVGPTIVTPWRERIEEAQTINDLERLLVELLSFRVLDPACGSGNFLYVAYRELRRVEHEIQTRISERRRGGMAMQGALAYVPTDHFYGIDVNPFAVEVAKVTMMLAKKLSTDELGDQQEVLPLDNLDGVITAKDALFSEWPKADAIIGNPPYLGRRKMVDELGAEYCQRLARFHPEVSGVSDFVCYWFPLAHKHLPPGGRAGLVATNTIRQNESRVSSLDYIADNDGIIFDAVSTQAWSGDAVVHVSIVNWSKGVDVSPKTLWLNDGQLRVNVDEIPTSLAPHIDVRKAAPLQVNQRPQMCFQGQTPGVTEGYVIDREARWSIQKSEPSSEAAIHPFLGGREMLRKLAIDRWVIDISEPDLVAADSTYPKIMQHLRRTVLPEREDAARNEEQNNAKVLAVNPSARVHHHHASFLSRWWQLGYRRAEMLQNLSGLDRYLATSRVSSVNRATVFAFVDASIRPGDSLTVFALDDDYSFGVLSSSLHRAWIEARCSTLKADLRYTSTTVWDSFPWPQTPVDQQVGLIVEVAAGILNLRQRYTERGISLAKQYDALRSPGKSQLRDLHSQLDEAVHAAYGFSKKDDLLAQLFALNQDLDSSPGVARRPGGGGFAGSRITDHRITPPIG